MKKLHKDLKFARPMAALLLLFVSSLVFLFCACGNGNDDKNVYTVSLQSNMSGIADILTDVEKDSEYTLPTYTEKNGYVFLGWAYSANAQNADLQGGEKITVDEDKAFFAVWKVETFTLTLDYYGDGMRQEIKKVDRGIFVLPVLMADDYMRGYEFLGWRYDYSSQPIEGTSVKITEDTTLRALWQIKTYSVSYNIDIGTLPDNAVKSFTINTMSYTSLPTPVETTMLFCYWAADAEGKTKVEKISECKDYVLYAVWEKAEAAMTFVYDAARNGYRLTKYDGNATIVEVPAVHKGLPVVEISANAFENCYKLKSVSIPDGIIKIGNNAFFLCRRLESVSIPDSVNEIGMDAFNSCESLKNIKLPDGLTEIFGRMFSGCTSLEIVSIPDSVKEIGSDVFRGCTSLERVPVPDSVKEVGAGAFRGCTSLESIVLPPSLRKIENSAFNGCKLKKLYIQSAAVANKIDGYFEGIDNAELFVKSDIAVENEYINFVYEKSPTAEVVDGVEYFRYTKKQ